MKTDNVVLKGVVVRVDSLKPKAEALIQIHFPKGSSTVPVSIVVLKAAKVAATGTSLICTVSKKGNRLISITADKDTNRKNKRRTRALVQSYIKELEDND